MAALCAAIGRRQGARARPAPAPIIKIRGLYRFHLQARCGKAGLLQSLMRELPASCRRRRASSWPSTLIQSACYEAASVSDAELAEIQENLRKPPKSNLQGRPIGVTSRRSFTP